MNAMIQESGEQSGSPRLGLLQLEMRVNVTDKTLLTNLRSARVNGVPSIQLMDGNDKTLAICGSGHSLHNTYGLIPPDADVMALNGAYKFLRSKEIIPTYFSMLDARDVNVNFLENLHDDTTYLLASQCHPDVFAKLSGKIVGMFHLNTPMTKKVFPDAELHIGGGGTIGLTAIALAMAIGYRRVILYGFDSSLYGDAQHVQKQPQNEKDEYIDVWVEERQYKTTRAMASQVMDFFPFYDGIRDIYPDFKIDLIGEGLFYDFIVTNNHPSSRERELNKYAAAYMEEDYGMTAERYNGLSILIEQLPCRGSYLDVSTGRGETLELAQKHGFANVKGTETVTTLCKGDRIVRAILPELPFGDKEFEVVSLIEVIEHLYKDDVEPALLELTRVAQKHILISAATRECYLGGVNLHPSARSLEKWQELFEKVWGARVCRVGNLGSSPAWRVDL